MPERHDQTTGVVRKMRAHREDAEQEALFGWIRIKEQANPLYSSIFAVPNGGLRMMREAVRLKKQGVKAGVSDIFVAVPAGPYHGMFLEMKRRKVKFQTPPVVSKEQKQWLEQQRALGYDCHIAFGWEEAKKLIEGYFMLRM